MTIRNLLRALPVAGVALALTAVPAAANTFVSAYVYNAVNIGNGAPPLEFSQRLDAPVPGPASVSASRPTGTTFSTTDYGLQRYYASANLAQPGNQQSAARGQFEDEIVINTGTPGQSGIATFQLRLTGTLFASSIATASSSFAWYNPASNTSFDNWLFVSYGEGLKQVDQLLTFQRSFVSGQVMLLSANWSADASVFTGGASGNAYADFSHTARWMGLQSVITSGGQDVTNAAVINSNSGFDYSSAAPGVPEPAVWAQLLAGFGLAGGVIRHRRRKMA